MKIYKIVLGLLVAAIFFLASCKKSSNPTYVGSWTFEGVKYTVDSCTAPNDSTLAAYSTGNARVTNTGDLYVQFHNTLPTTSGTFTYVVTPSYHPAAGQVWLWTTSGNSYGDPYNSTGGNGSQTVTVTVSAAGKINITGANIEFSNLDNPADSGALTFNITQTN